MIRRSHAIALAVCMLLSGVVATLRAQTVTGGPFGYTEGTWTPVMTFATPGDLAISSYSVQQGQYTKAGRGVLAGFSIAIAAGNYTQTTASGNLLITGIPFTIGGGASLTYMGAATWQGITKATYTQCSWQANATGTFFIMSCSGTAVAASNVAAADMPTAGVVILRGTVNYACTSC